MNGPFSAKKENKTSLNIYFNRYMISLKLLWLYRGNLRTLAYVALRRLICPFKKMEKLLAGAATVVDIGSGQGLFSIYCVLKHHRVTGFEPKPARIIAGARAARHLPGLLFVRGYFNVKPGSIDAACLSDVLHHLPYDGQKELLARIHDSLSAWGMLLVKEICVNDGWRYGLSAFSDTMLYPAEKCFFRSREDWMELLKSCNFAVKHCRTKSPLSTNIFVASRNA